MQKPTVPLLPLQQLPRQRRAAGRLQPQGRGRSAAVPASRDRRPRDRRHRLDHQLPERLREGPDPRGLSQRVVVLRADRGENRRNPRRPRSGQPVPVAADGVAREETLMDRTDRDTAARGWSTRRFATANRRRAWPSRAPRNWPSPGCWPRPGCRNSKSARPPWATRKSPPSAPSSRLGLPCRLTAWCRASRGRHRPGRRQRRRRGPYLPARLGDPSAGDEEEPGLGLASRSPTSSAYARQRFAFVSIGAQDASRAAPSFLARCARTARQAGADRFRLADTVGVWNPFQVHAAIPSLRHAAPELALGFHGHNDLGMATANTLAAVMAGAASVDVTVNGLGERAGNAPLEEVVMALRLTLGQDAAASTPGDSPSFPRWSPGRPAGRCRSTSRSPARASSATSRAFTCAGCWPTGGPMSRFPPRPSATGRRKSSWESTPAARPSGKRCRPKESRPARSEAEGLLARMRAGTREDPADQAARDRAGVPAICSTKCRAL